ncbi:YciI family protein [Streptomyces boninensis]|uniref:YciI family protein n=1 Tax=Streptomyces boninensis TaxID=2039455 RepID=UPI003B21C5F9
MRYMLLICGNNAPDAPAEGTGTAGTLPIEEWVEKYTVEHGEGHGTRLHGDRLRPPGDAVTVRVRGGEVLRTDGPFAETKEYVAGYDLFECDTLEQALTAAAEHPMAAGGAVEVRAFWDPAPGEPEIRRILAELAAAGADGDVERAAACYAPDAVVYGGGAAADRVKVFGAGEPRELHVQADERSGFSHAVVGPYRVTTGYRSFGEQWRIVHQHISDAS